MGEQIVVVGEGRSDVNCLLADWMFLSSGRVPVFSWAVSVRLTAIAYQICRLRLVIGGWEGGGGGRGRTGYCPPHEQHVSTGAAVHDHQIKWATTFLIHNTISP